MKYRIGRKLVRDRTAKARLKEVRVTESMFADDVAVYATSRDMLEQVVGGGGGGGGYGDSLSAYRRQSY